jgi:P-type Cu+ transporter
LAVCDPFPRSHIRFARLHFNSIAEDKNAMTTEQAQQPNATCDYCHLPVRVQGNVGGDGPLYCCYGCRFAAQITQARGERGQATWMVTRLGGSIFLSMGVMVFSLAMYSQDVYDIDLSQESAFASQWIGLLRYASLVMATPVFLMLGLPILSNAFDQLARRQITTDALVIVGVGAAFLSSYISTLTDSGAVYYETACMILVLLTLGRYLEAIGRLRASEAVEKLHELVPDTVSVVRAGKSISVSAGDIRKDDVFEVAAGDRIAADGVIQHGRAHVDEMIVTGESVPVEKSPGDIVHAGGTNTDGLLTIRATTDGSDSALTRLLALLEEAKRSKGSYERLADRVAGVFVPVVIVLAGVAAFLGYGRGGTDEAIMTALAVLVISCPCALGIATPLAIWVGLGRGASRGVLFRNGETVEKLASVRAVAFDKTGTITTGNPTVETVHVTPNDRTGDDQIRAWMRGMAETSRHVLARSLARYLAHEGIEHGEVTDIQNIPGRGVTGTTAGRIVRLGSVTMMREAQISFPEKLEQAATSAMTNALGVVCFAVEDEVHAVASFSESTRENAQASLAQLRHLGLDVSILTGDHAKRAERIGLALDVEVLSELSPPDKVAAIGRLQTTNGSVAMVGDGLNDAPALSAANVGIAMGCGADLTRESGDVCLLGNNLEDVPFAISLARKTVRTVRANLFWAFIYNAIGIALAIGGLLNPMVAAGAMVLSSLFVVTNSLRLGRASVGDTHPPMA